MNKGLKSILSLSFYGLRLNRGRALITISIIALGISALVGMQTAIDGMKWSLVSRLNTLGNNTFSITRSTSSISFGHSFAKDRPPPIDYRLAERFKDRLAFPASVSISAELSGGFAVSHHRRKTNPDIRLSGIDENFLVSSGINLTNGRNITPSEAANGTNVALIGAELNNILFGGINSCGKTIRIRGMRYTIIGLCEERGKTFGQSQDKIVFIPLLNARKHYSSHLSEDFHIKVHVDDVFQLESAISESMGLLRVLRGLKPGEKNNFGIRKSESLQELLDENLSYVSTAASVIGLITLFGAVIALMNIMLVSVTERTKEIGTRMAVGAGPKLVRLQFLGEATIISLIGGAIGIGAGLGIGNLVIVLLQLKAHLPYDWVAISVALCVLVGIIAGYAPASKAASLDPIESLRYE